jgi:hypothetical protein
MVMNNGGEMVMKTGGMDWASYHQHSSPLFITTNHHQYSSP